MIRLFCDEFEVIVPSKAHSTATLICLGADRVVMTKQATLGPIDPGINDPPNPPSIDSIIRRLVKVGAKVVYHVRRWYVHIASAFSLARYYRILLVIGLTSDLSRGAATNWGEVVVS